MVRASAHDSDLDSVLRVPASITVDHIDFSPGVEVALGQVAEDLEGSESHGSVDISPGDFLFSDGIDDDGLGGRGSAE